ncbi:hypothetical protein HMI55_001553 [Coelomomyces lativittatus]|nr:hypothetical protein HMI55_001553 [Coelomomyces lativittatus]
MGNEQSTAPVQDVSSTSFTTLEKENENEQLCKQYQLSPEEFDAALKTFSTLTSGDMRQKWILDRTRRLLFPSKQMTLTLYLQLIHWWKTSSDQTKLQYLFYFMDLDADGFITCMDLMGVLEQVIESYHIQKGDWVALKSNGKKGLVHYVGPHHNSTKSGTWVGIELSKPGVWEYEWHFKKS